MKELENSELDIVWCMVKIGSLNTLIASVYCPPTNGDVTLLKKILSNMDQAVNYGEINGIKNMLILGDFNSRNVNWCDTTTNQRGRVLLKYINETEFNLFTPVENTYVCVNGGSVIDLMIGYGEIAKQVEISWIEKSTELYSGAPQRGHYPIIYSLTIKGYKEEKKRVNDYNNTDWDTWKGHLDSELKRHTNLVEEDIKEEGQLREIVEVLSDKIISANDIIPKKVICKHSKPFWNEELSKMSKELAELHNRARVRGTPNNIEALSIKKEEYKAALIDTSNNWIRNKLSNLNISDINVFWKRYLGLSLVIGKLATLAT